MKKKRRLFDTAIIQRFVASHNIEEIAITSAREACLKYIEEQLLDLNIYDRIIIRNDTISLFVPSNSVSGVDGQYCIRVYVNVKTAELEDGSDSDTIIGWVRIHYFLDGTLMSIEPDLHTLLKFEDE